MTDQQAGWMWGLIEPLRVKPGSHVNLASDFDPGARFGVRKKGDGQDLLRQGVELLAEYQDRLAAQNTCSRCWSCCRHSMRRARTARSGTCCAG